MSSQLAARHRRWFSAQLNEPRHHDSRHGEGQRCPDVPGNSNSPESVTQFDDHFDVDDPFDDHSVSDGRSDSNSRDGVATRPLGSFGPTNHLYK